MPEPTAATVLSSSHRPRATQSLPLHQPFAVSAAPAAPVAEHQREHSLAPAPSAPMMMWPQRTAEPVPAATQSVPMDPSGLLLHAQAPAPAQPPPGASESRRPTEEIGRLQRLRLLRSLSSTPVRDTTPLPEEWNQGTSTTPNDVSGGTTSSATAPLVGGESGGMATAVRSNEEVPKPSPPSPHLPLGSSAAWFQRQQQHEQHQQRPPPQHRRLRFPSPGSAVLGDAAEPSPSLVPSWRQAEAASASAPAPFPTPSYVPMDAPNGVAPPPFQHPGAGAGAGAGTGPRPRPWHDDAPFQRLSPHQQPHRWPFASQLSAMPDTLHAGAGGGVPTSSDPTMMTAATAPSEDLTPSWRRASSTTAAAHGHAPAPARARARAQASARAPEMTPSWASTAPPPPWSRLAPAAVTTAAARAGGAAGHNMYASSPFFGSPTPHQTSAAAATDVHAGSVHTAASVANSAVSWQRAWGRPPALHAVTSSILDHRNPTQPFHNNNNSNTSNNSGSSHNHSNNRRRSSSTGTKEGASLPRADVEHGRELLKELRASRGRDADGPVPSGAVSTASGASSASNIAEALREQRAAYVP